MPTLPPVFTSIILSFAPLFCHRVWERAQVLLMGAMLAPGKRTVTSALRVMGLSAERHFQNYHRVLNRAVWSCRSGQPHPVPSAADYLRTQRRPRPRPG
jgi:hypothetical protein